MATSVTRRPIKELEDGFLSRWNSITLPLIYEFTNDKFPINTADTIADIVNITYDGVRGGTQVIFNFADDPVPLDKLTFQNTGIPGMDGEVLTVLPSDLPTGLVLVDFFTDQTSTQGNFIKFYNNYKVLVNVFKGAPPGHPYLEDDTKPLEEVGTIEVDFLQKDGVNVGIADLRTLAGLGTNSDFDYEDENSRNSWNAFFIEFAESHDESNGNEILTFVDDFQFDTNENCVVDVGFVDPDFDNGLTDWFQEELNPGGTLWTTGVGNITINIGANGESQIINQPIQLNANATYLVTATLDLTFASGSFEYNANIYGFDGTDWIPLASQNFNGTGDKFFAQEIVPSTPLQKLGMVVTTVASSNNSFIDLKFFDVANPVGVQATNPNFDDGLDGWDQTDNQGSTSPWVAGVGSITSTVTSGESTDILFQETEVILQGTPISFVIDFDLISGTVNDNLVLYVTGWNGLSRVEATVESRHTMAVLGVGNFTFDTYFANDSIVELAVHVRGSAPATAPFTVQFDKVDFFSQVVEWKNPNFDDGLDNWLATCNQSSCEPWVAGVGSITVTGQNSDTLYQEFIVFEGEELHIEVDFESFSAQESVLEIFARRIQTDTWDLIESELFLGIGTHNIVFDHTTVRDYDAVGWELIVQGVGSNSWEVFRAEIIGPEEEPIACIAILMAAYGTNQFQNALGGNFGDFVAHNTNALFMTVFDEYRYFNGSPFYASIIIPESLFAASIDDNTVFLQIIFRDFTGASLGVFNYNVEATGEGVYHINPDIEQFLIDEGIGANDWKNATMSLLQSLATGGTDFVSEEKIINNSLACAPSFSPVPMRFLNAVGGWDTWTFQQLKVLDEVRTKNVIVKRDILSDFDNVFINGDTQYQSVKIDSRKSLILRTLTVTEEELVGLSQLCNSVRVQIFINARFVTSSVDTNAMNVFNEDIKTRVLTMEVRLPDTLNQTS